MDKHDDDYDMKIDEWLYDARKGLVEAKFEGDDKNTIEKVVQETSDWLDDGEDSGEYLDFEAKFKDLEGVVNPIMNKVFGDRKDCLEITCLENTCITVKITSTVDATGDMKKIEKAVQETADILYMIQLA